MANNYPIALKTKPSIQYKNTWLQLLTCSCRASELLKLKLPIKRVFVLMMKKLAQYKATASVKYCIEWIDFRKMRRNLQFTKLGEYFTDMVHFVAVA